MALTLSGDDGVAGVNGSAATPAIQGTDTNTGLTFGTDTVNLVTGGSNRATVDSNGDFSVNTDSLFVDASADRVGINTSSPQTMLQIGDSSSGNGVPKLRLHRGSGSDYFEVDCSGGSPTLQAVGGGDLKFATGSSERMRIAGGGNILFHATSAPASGNAGSGFIPDTNSRSVLFMRTDTTGGRVLCNFGNTNGETGSIQVSGTSTSYVTSSDYRLKENVVDLDDAITRVKQLAPKRFNFIADADTVVDGFIAHEAQAVVPEAVTGTQDEVEVWEEGEELPDGVSVGDNKLNEDGNPIPKYQGIDQSKLVPLLTAALQEALAKIETLETRLTALEGGAS